MRLKRTSIGVFLTLVHLGCGDYEVTNKWIFLTNFAKPITNAINIS